MAAVTVCSDFGAQENEICHCFHMLGYIVRKSEKVKALWPHGLQYARPQSCQTLWPCGLRPTRLLPPWNSPGKSIGVGCHFLSGDLPDPGIEPRSPALQADSLPFEPPGKPILWSINSYSYNHPIASVPFTLLDKRISGTVFHVCVTAILSKN